MNGPSYSVSSPGIPEGTFVGPRLEEVKPDPLEPGVSVFVMTVRYKGKLDRTPSLDLALEGAQNLVSLRDAIEAAKVARIEADRERGDAVRAKELLAQGLDRLDRLTEDRARRLSADAHRRANRAEAELRKLRAALSVVGEAFGITEGL